MKGGSLSNRDPSFFDNCSRFVRHIAYRECILCNGPAAGAPWCEACDMDLPKLTDAVCERCAIALPARGLCGNCLSRPPRFDHAEAVYAYAFPVDRLIGALKYGARISLASQFGSLLARHTRQQPDALIAMPLSRERIVSRGYNQAHEIARRLALERGIPLLDDACRRVVDTPSQSALPWNARAKNVRRAFVCSESLSGAHVAIVDDVLTTGSTMNELARVIREAGAASVTAWVVCRTLKPGDTVAPGIWPAPPRIRLNPTDRTSS